MFGGSFDLAILSGPLALHRAKRFWWSGLCDCRCLRGRFCLIATISPPSPVGHVFWPAARTIRWCFIVPKHCSIPQAVLGVQPAPAFFRNTQGVDDGWLFAYDPVTIA
ncbi:MAG: hypothetical protein GDA36_13625 [Rhodobacteraceae bacterium]|nr:hypothetical protein [Paracoccaceae bacterium]